VSTVPDPPQAEPTQGTPGLVLANVATLAVALAFDWPPASLMWPYWLQSLVIGGFAVRRMLNAPRISTEGFKSNGKPVPATREGRVQTARFFCIHFGGFHLGYAFFIASGSGLPQGVDLWATLAAAAAFAWSTEDAYRRNRATLEAAPLNLGAAMFLPYLRILPMHLTIIFGGVAFSGGGAWTLVLFTLLKTAADVAMNLAEQAILRRQRAVRSAAA
jgi:Family of unknown function (DUF6498)